MPGNVRRHGECGSLLINFVNLINYVELGGDMLAYCDSV